VAKKGKILFDLGHNEDPLGSLVEELKKDGFICYTHRDLITPETLEPYTSLFLAYPRKDFEEEEIKTIVEFSRQGGNVTITANPQTQKEYEIFIENKGGIIKSLLNTEMQYKQLHPRIPLYAIEDKIQYLPLKAGVTPSDVGIPYSDIMNFFPINLERLDLLENIKEIFEGKITGFSFFSPIDEENILLRKWVNVLPPSPDDMGFDYERLDRRSRKIIEEAAEMECDELRFACVGLLNPMQKGAGRNLGFCGNLFVDEFIEQDKEKKANFRLIADLLKYCSEARLYVISTEESKPEGIEVPVKPEIKTKPLIVLPKYTEEFGNLENLLKQLATDTLKNMPRGTLVGIQDQIVSNLETVLFGMRAEKIKEELDEEDKKLLKNSYELQEQLKKPPSDEKLSELELRGIREYSYVFQNYINKTKREIGIPTNLSN